MTSAVSLGGSVTGTAATVSEADRYQKEVAPHVAALPAEERAEPLEDLALHVQEVAAEPGSPHRPSGQWRRSNRS